MINMHDLQLWLYTQYILISVTFKALKLLLLLLLTTWCYLSHIWFFKKINKTTTSKIKRVFNIFCKKKIKNKKKPVKQFWVDFYKTISISQIYHTKCRIQQVRKLKSNKNNIWPLPLHPEQNDPLKLICGQRCRFLTGLKLY